MTGRVIGAKEVRVGSDKVGLTRLSVQVVSGLQLNISPDSSIENGYVAETSVTRKLTAQYQVSNNEQNLYSSVFSVYYFVVLRIFMYNFFHFAW